MHMYFLGIWHGTVPMFWLRLIPTQFPVLVLSREADPDGGAVPSVNIQVVPSSDRVSPIHTGRMFLRKIANSIQNLVHVRYNSRKRLFLYEFTLFRFIN